MRRFSALAATAALLVLATPADAHKYVTVLPGDTLAGIAATVGWTEAALAHENGLDPAVPLLAGANVLLPYGAPNGPAVADATPTPASASTPATPSPLGGYRVRLGDSLSAIAARHGVSLSALAASNGLDPAGVLLAGRVLRLPGGSAPASSTAIATSTSSGTVVQAAPGRTTADRIRQIAGEHGVPGDLAAAIAWQESGFNNATRSVADARGVMQILPSTWDWIQGSLARQRLNPASVDDNVRAGSLMLGQLLRETGGDPALAAAGYYQGLASVRRVGMLPDTKQYVANVLALRGRFGG